MNQRTVDVTPPEVQLTQRLIAETREENRRADAKAAQWLSMLGGGVIGVLALWGAPLESSWPAGASAAWTVGLGFFCAGVAAVAFALALYPRTRAGSDLRDIAYFGHVHRAGDPALVRRYLEEAAGDTMPGLVGQLCRLSRIAVVKYRCVRVGTVFGMLAAVLLLAVLF
ncbi:Pycsar system effector family protein [Actinoplanes sp. NPDC051861]|uniref:Pycsar system effector family protein n=1 Tax=Actinoplanes sp. NPDC051861 TaxID=3155170 RepID=UPI003415EA5C